LFVGTSYIPSIVGTQKEKIVFTSFASHGYIQDLINNASDGDTIYIPSGTYHENIFINKSISLIGEDKNTTIIDGGANVDVIFIFSDWVNISGFTIQNSSDNAGIKIISKYCNIFNNIFLDNQVGIYSYASNDNIIKRNIFIDELIDVYIFNSYNLTIINNDFWSTGLMIDSFYLEFWNSHNIQNNNLTGGKIYYYKDNSDGCNIPYDAKQIILANCSNFTIQNYSISKVGLAIQLGHSFNNSIIFNNISNTFCAIDLCCSDNNNISDNIINENEFGILVLFEYSEGNRIYCNSLNNNKHGIYFYDPPLLVTYSPS
jgi:parallel beta-helix repeat protein